MHCLFPAVVGRKTKKNFVLAKPQPKLFIKNIELLSEQDLERFERLRRFTSHRYVERKFLSVVVMMVRYLCI